MCANWTEVITQKYIFLWSGQITVFYPIVQHLLFRVARQIPVFKVTGLNLNLLVKPRIISGFLEKNIILCILHVAFQNA